MLDIFPSKNDFITGVRANSVRPLHACIPYKSPQQLYEAVPSAGSFLLESIKGPEKIARYSFIGSEPFLTLRIKNGSCELHNRGNTRSVSGAPLKILKELVQSYSTRPDASLPPFIGGVVGVISYDFVHYFERLPRTVCDDLKLPDADFLFVDSLIAVDHVLKKTFLIACPGAERCVLGDSGKSASWDNEYEGAYQKIQSLYEKVRSPSTSIHTPLHKHESPGTLSIRHDMKKEQYMRIVRRTKEYIRAGDIFQANLSQRVSAQIGDTPPWHIYKILSRINPSPFAAYMDMGDYFLVSSSPERLVRVSGDNVETRPIAGTRPRGKDADADRRLRNDLLLNEKERAEHIMLIDLERNDLGKIADYSTIEVDELMITENYSHVMHIVSNIRGKIVRGKDCFDAIRATFPGGTITGVPKVRCMEIIDELETVVRGPYTGSIGYISFTGDMDLNIIIRTFVIKDRVAYVQAGAGIVADSDPEREYYETMKKAEALIRTLELM